MRNSFLCVSALLLSVCLLPLAAQDGSVPNAAQGITDDSGAMAAGGGTLQHSEFSIQLSGIYQAHTASGTVKDAPTDSGGLLVGYRLHLGHWSALEAEYGYTRNSQVFYTPSLGPLSPAANYGVVASSHEFVVNEVVNTPRLAGIFQPFVLAGGGIVIFVPHGSTAIAVHDQGRGAINYGAGVDFHVDHVGLRIEYQGLVFKVPNFKNDALNVNRFTNLSQPSAGLIFTF